MRDVSFNLDSNLKPEKAFALTPPPTPDFSKVTALPDDWLTQLEKMCCDHNRTLLEPFKKHIGNECFYSKKAELETELKTIYYRLTNMLDNQLGILTDSERNSILAKLTEEIRACTAGFHNRVNAVILSMQLPSSLAHLLYKVRQSLVENTAASLTNEVHAANRVTFVANASGFGIKTNCEHDHYVGALSDADILVALNSKFESDYTPFNIPILLCDQLRGALSNFGYFGRKEGERDADKTYDVGDAKAFAALIKRCLNIPEETGLSDAWYVEYFIIEEEGDEYKTYIRDINWPKINKLFLEVLEKEYYFNEKPVPEKLWEHAYYRSKEETLNETQKLISLATTRELKKALISQLKKVRLICPDIYIAIISDSKNMQEICSFYITEIRDLITIAQKKGYLTEILTELKQLKLTSPKIYQELLKCGEIKRLIENVIKFIAPTTFTSRVKVMINPPSLILISQAFQLLIDIKTPELESNIQALTLALIREKYEFTTKNFNSAISIAKIMHQHFNNFSNKALQVFLNRCITDETLLIKALEQLPQNSWMSFIEIPGIPCSNAMKNAISFIVNKKTIPLAEALKTYDALEKLGGNYAKNFLDVVIENSKNTETVKNPEFLIMLSRIAKENNLSELISVIKCGLQESTMESWVKFLETSDTYNLNIFLNLAYKSKESKSLRLALADVLKKNSENTLIPIIDDNLDYDEKQLRQYRQNLKNRHELFLKIVSIASTANDEKVELCNAIAESYKSENTLFSNLLRFPFEFSMECIEALFALANDLSQESASLRSIILEMFNLPHIISSKLFSRFTSNVLFLYTDLLKKEINYGDPTNTASAILNKRPFHIYKMLSELTSELSSNGFIKLLRNVNKDVRMDIYYFESIRKINTDDQLKVFLIAKLTAYMDSNSVDPSAKNYASFFSFTLNDTKLRLADAKKLIGEIVSCATIADMKSKITTSKSLFVGGPYKACLVACDEKLGQYNLTTLESSLQSSRAPKA